MLFIYILTIDWRIALLSLATLPVAGIAMVWMLKDSIVRFQRTQDTTKDLNDTAVEYIGGIEVIKVFGKVESSYQRFADAARKNSDSFIDWMYDCIIPFSLGMVIAPATLLAVLPIGAIFTMHGSLSLPDFETEHVKAGRKGRIVLKMNGLHDRRMIDELYRAGSAGVEIDLLMRGICCLVPDQPYSPNIRVTQIVDMFLEHTRIWYFYNDGAEDLYLTSSDWMNRNLNRRIETAAPVLSPSVKREMIDILHIQLQDNVKACRIDAQLRNVFVRNDAPPVRAQQAIYDYIKAKTEGC